MSIQSEVYITKNELFINQAPSFNFELDEEDMAVMDGLNENFRVSSDPTGMK